MPDRSTDRCPGEDAAPDLPTALVHLTGRVRETHAAASEEHELTPVQARLLCVLLAGPRGMAELASGFGVERAALTGLVDRAERRGLVERAPVPADRRALQVVLTAEGRRAAGAFHADVNARIERLLDSLSDDERNRFHDLLRKVLRGDE